jgi:hypothetical protein
MIRSESNTPTGYQVLTEGVTTLAQELGRPLAITFPAEARLLTPEAARAMLEELRKQAQAGVI